MILLFVDFMCFVFPTNSYLTGGMTRTNIYSFIRRLLDWPFSELFFSDTSLWNQYKFIAFDIFSCKILIISCKMLFITVCKKHYNILSTRDSFFVSTGGKIESLRQFKVKLLSSSCFIAGDSHIKIMSSLTEVSIKNAIFCFSVNV